MGRAIRTPKTAELVARKLRRMIVDGELKDGDHLPHEAELMEHFSVSRPTLREAVRVLEAERLVEVRRGSRSGARVCVPGPEVVARPASLLLELSGATVADVYIARQAIEPTAARLLAETGTDEAFDELERIVDEAIPASYESGTFGQTAARFHLRMVQLAGNATLALIAGMLHEIYERHTTNVTQERLSTDVEKYETNYKLFVRSQRKLIKLLRARDGSGAFTHWQKHMVVAESLVLSGREDTKVRDILD
ncbi:FadR/GntR family transcriptional regulator [Rhodococcus rhodochrous]|uniref:GntR family transcriptional regulator n=2 Tax=Rhodococcus rhodochrous TaxID=1829 RepID=A0AA47AE38_RHORH|nr:GntR family transcriptional regulator [Rhodococcus rhodochrous]MBF4479309.1 FadR family transcriptional regulator [Rhodococcus rhodochrous]MCB8913457.1 GntR family transcriptional regulator [Rhodococcus rhodochrous]MCD2100371.1 GntR family transcriptional regulator [Rhodococcus rhodochrous]MCD2124689.1 GntR family transcriptional regulator [Rhodococcus rhodochrous]MCQ4138011.1 GntR family transcriptional regulator [Rhodococcus rhodochrous]